MPNQLAYAEVTVGVNITATTEATAQTFADSGSRTYDPSPILVEFYSPAVETGASAGSTTTLNLWDGSTNLGIIAAVLATGSSEKDAVEVRRFLTPSAGSHQYIVKAWRATSDGRVNAGTGGIGAFMPAYIRITTGS